MSIAVCSGLVTIQWINLLCGQAFGFKFHCQKLNDLVTIEGTFCCMIYISWVDGYFVLSSILMSVLGTFERKPMGHKQLQRGPINTDKRLSCFFAGEKLQGP